ncbi:DUF6369 family protein [Pseudomonas sp. BF-B-30]|jgi:hypothetical protein|uniref:DUF6369 family protein n=1 Tax=Pseudomonas sp. BF-B-30 TaxID=2832388 RepID=UPI001CC09D4A|nr:DUF6369 family protein [Pseudomonas sp. BF-B-30]
MFIVLSLLFSILGIFSTNKPKITLLLFILLAAAVPSSSAFEKIVSNYGMYFYESFILTASLIYLIKKPKAIFKKEFTTQLLTLLMLIIYLAIGSVIYGLDKYLFREMRLILCIALPLLMIPAIRKISLTETEVSKIVIVTSIFHAIAFLAFSSNLISVSNVYYSEENRYRYSGFSTYLCAAFLIFAATNKEKFKRKSLFHIASILAVAVVLIAGSRIMIFGLVLSLMLASTKSAKSFAYSLGVTLIMCLTFYYVAQSLGDERLNNTFKIETLTTQIAIRLSPATKYLETAGPIQAILGHGLGATFEIPWFEYQNLDTKHNTIDSAYPTLWIKIGAFTILYIFALIKMAAFNQSNKTKKAIYVFLLITMLTTSLPYQPLFSVFILFMLLLSRMVYAKVEPRHAN